MVKFPSMERVQSIYLSIVKVKQVAVKKVGAYSCWLCGGNNVISLLLHFYITTYNRLTLISLLFQLQ